METEKVKFGSLKKLPKEKIMIMLLFLFVTVISFSNTTEVAADGFEKFVSYIVLFKNMTLYLLMVIGAGLFIWGLIQMFNRGDFGEIAIKLLGGIFLFAVGFNIEKGAVAVGGTLINSAEIGLRMIVKY
ncbi:hypothetical protein EII29_02530 [Leptotrichia sp. OH3620_COT-345]|uniref:hypothetical protein n=1 Tax=Leptotrichia sp. OH3620_COT-345 TaxID=2491048 RepID=UPI000F64DC93|nr:hypothetical protein [Leptotrichia sp. OH3620_COT-345]RRD40374.1 hypothetical protein EII29_02530 [Leptotrichia sp. OH3620_COT-345]